MIRNRSEPSPALILLLALAACGGGAPGPAGGGGVLDETPAPAAATAQGACDMVAARGSCVAYSGMTAYVLSVNEASCGTYQGTFGASCPAAGLVGTCTIPSFLGLNQLQLYAPWTTANGSAMCMNGAWSVPSPPVETASPATVSCMDPWDGTCADTSGAMTPTLRLGVQRFCTGNDRILLDAPCPSAGRSGSCVTAPGELVWRTRHYDAPSLLADRQSCAAMGGRWTDG